MCIAESIAEITYLCHCTNESKEEWRAVLMSTKDIAYKNRTTEIITENEKISIPMPDHDVLCNSCNGNIYPDNGWLMEYKEGEKWFTYDIYCDDCQEKYFPDAMKCVLDTWMDK